MSKLTRPKFLLAISFALAWGFDYLFWGKQWGISVPVFTLLLVLVGLLLARRQGLQPARASLWLLLPLLFFAVVSAFRLEPLTVLVSRALVLLLSALLAVTFLGGHWLDYSFSDFVAKLVSLVPNGLGLLRDTTPADRNAKEKSFSIRSLAPVFRGLLFALPILWFLSILLSSADPYFSRWLTDLFQFLKIENLSDYLFRAFYIVVFTYIIASVYLFALIKSRKEQLISEKKPWLKPLVGFAEAATVLVSVNLLFTAFVFVQLKYFFGGVANIVDNPNGLTFAEYARRGFSEMVFVAVISLLLFIALSTIGKRQKNQQQKWFSGLGIWLFALVAIILVSTYQRLLLYESAYGFSRLRTYSHVFMIWLGLLLLAVVILEVLRKQRAFALAVLLVALGFAASLSSLNVDGFITRANIQRAELGYEFDVPYLASLSEDAVPALLDQYNQLDLASKPDLAGQVAAAMACHAELHEKYTTILPWQSWNWSRSRANQIWHEAKESDHLPNYAASLDADNHLLSIQIGGQQYACEGSGSWD